jgi:hypothetical protein
MTIGVRIDLSNVLDLRAGIGELLDGELGLGLVLPAAAALDSCGQRYSLKPGTALAPAISRPEGSRCMSCRLIVSTARSFSVVVRLHIPVNLVRIVRVNLFAASHDVRRGWCRWC